MSEARESGHSSGGSIEIVVWPRWLLVLSAAALLFMAGQRPVASGVPVSLADPLVMLACAGVFLALWRGGLAVPVPWLLLVFLAAYAGANLVAGSGRPGAIECAQRIEQLLCGFVVLQLLLRERPGWVRRLVGLGLAANVILALAQMPRCGFGPTMAGTTAVTGFFASRMALSFFLALGLCWCLPSWLSWTHTLLREGLVALAMALVLACILHGQMLLVAAGVLVFLGFCHSRRGLGTVAAGLLLFLASLWLGPNAATRREQLAISVSPFRADGQIHQAHTELVAAVRMANQYPLAGVGAGRYQGSIGTFYGELPDPNVNDIERDTQSGFGVLLGTVGYPAGLLWLLLLLAALATASERYFASQRSDLLALGAAGAVGVVLAGSAISDPFVRGVCWYAVLALASAFCTSPEAAAAETAPLGSVRLLGWRALLLWGLVLGAAGLGVALRAQAPQAIAGMDGGSGSRPHAAPATPASASSAATTPAGGTEAAAPAATATPTVTFQTDAEFFRILNPEAAKTVTPPMESAKDPTGAKGVVLRIPDEKGKPPDGAEPDMKYGGATYELEMPKNLKCRVWMRVWWEGACGNSLFLRVEDGKPLVLGNDGTYNVWHWLAVPATVELKQGKNTLYVLNREDGIRLDQVLITGDAEYVPQGIEEE